MEHTHTYWIQWNTAHIQAFIQHHFSAATIFYFKHTHVHTCGYGKWPNLFFLGNPFLVHGRSTGRSTLDAPLSTYILVVVALLCSPGGNQPQISHCAKKPVTTMLTYPWKCTVLHCNHLGHTWKLLVLMTRHFDYCPSAGEGDNQSVRSSAPVVSRCFPGGYNVKQYISRGRLAWWLLAFLCCVLLSTPTTTI